MKKQIKRIKVKGHYRIYREETIVNIGKHKYHAITSAKKWVKPYWRKVWTHII